METRFLQRNEIDTGRWDKTISTASAETLYPYSWYLDAAASRWSALVTGDYSYIMPLVWKRKYGLPYLYQPFYTQQLGIFSEKPADPELVTLMLSQARKKFCFGTIHFNAENQVVGGRRLMVEERSNCILPLRGDYDQISASYTTNAKRNLKRAREAGLNVVKEVSCEELVAFKRANDVIRRSDAEYSWLIRLLETVRREAGGTIYAVRNGGGLEAAAFFGFSRNRAIYLVSVSGDRGKEKRAMFGIVDEFIREYAGSERILDFEGSSIPSVARFFEGFGAVRDPYRRVHFSNLPFIRRRPGRDG